MNVLIYGSKNFGDLDLVREFVKHLPDDTVLISVRGDGVNNVARNQATFQQFYVIDIHVDHHEWSDCDPLDAPLLALVRADEVYCFWDGIEPDTRVIAELAKEAGKLQDLVIQERIVE